MIDVITELVVFPKMYYSMPQTDKVLDEGKPIGIVKCREFFCTDWTLATDDEFIEMLPVILEFNKHSHMKRVWNAVKTRSPTFQYRIFVKLV
jgi:hypothetical protein